MEVDFFARRRRLRHIPTVPEIRATYMYVTYRLKLRAVWNPDWCQQDLENVLWWGACSGS